MSDESGAPLMTHHLSLITPAVAVAGLRKAYGAVRAVDGVDLAVPDGRLLALLGPSGCGKTTTLRLIAGFIAPDTGTIHAGGRLVSTRQRVVPPEERGMGMVFQNYAVWPHKTVFENVVFGLKLRGLSSAAARARVRDTLALVNLTGFEDRLPSALHLDRCRRRPLARPRQVSHGLRDRRIEVHLLRHVRGSLPCRCDRIDQHLRYLGADAGRNALRQGEAVKHLR